MIDEPPTRPLVTYRDPWVLAAAAVALTIALLYGFLAHPLFNPDDYVRWAVDFPTWWRTAQDQFVMRTPGYPLFLYLFFQLGLGNAPIIVVQSLVLAGACVLTAALTVGAAGVRAGRIAAWCFAGYFPLLTYAGTAMTEVLATALVLVAALAVLRLHRTPEHWLRWGALGATCVALGMIVRPNVAMYAGVIGLALLWVTWRAGRGDAVDGGAGAHSLSRGERLRRVARMAGVIVACTAIVFSPWVIRNLSYDSALQPFGDDGTYPLALGLHLPWDKTSGRYGSFDRSNHFFGNTRPDHFSTPQARQVRALDELKNDLEHHFGEFAESRALMAYNMWFWPATPRIQDGVPEVIPYGLVRGVHLFMLFLGVTGLWLLRRSAFGKLAIALTGVTFAVELIYWSNPRYVLPVAPYLLAGSGVTLVALFNLVRARLDRRGVLDRLAAARRARRGEPAPVES